jgi:membrane protein DedA with SNARE-associated domain
MWFCAVLYRGLVGMAEPELVIPVGDKALKPDYAWGFWLLLSIGIINTVLGAALWYILGKHGYKATQHDVPSMNSKLTSTRTGATEATG